MKFMKHDLFLAMAIISLFIMFLALFSNAPLWTIWLWLGAYGVCTAFVAICELKAKNEGPH